MPKSIPEGLTQQHILSALADLDSGIDAPFGPATGYELVHNGKRYAPKAVIGLAFKHLTGQMLAHGEFSGGEALGQANYVLRNLGFDVVAKSDGARSEFITSRGFALPRNESEMAEKLWFNIWQRRLWPYKELDEGDTLYWYDTKEQAIVWRSPLGSPSRDRANSLRPGSSTGFERYTLIPSGAGFGEHSTSATDGLEVDSHQDRLLGSTVEFA